MSLVTTKDLMLDAQKNHYAIGAFNAENMEMVQAIIAAAEELHAPVIVQTTPGTLKYALRPCSTPWWPQPLLRPASPS